MRRNIKETQVFIAFATLTVLLIILINLIFNSYIKSIKNNIVQAKNQYSKVLNLYRKIESNSSSKTSFNNNILLFVQKLGSLNNLKNKIVSANATNTGNSVEIRIVAINLSQLISIFETISRYKNIKIIRFTLKKNFSNNNLADLDITIGKVM